MVDCKVLCSIGAPKEFWWGVRSTGADLFQPNLLESMEWALAREQHNSEQFYYHYTGNTLCHIELHTLIRQLAKSLKVKDYEQHWHDARAALSPPGEVRLRTPQEQIVYQQVSQVALQAEAAYRRVVSIKQRYHS